MASLGSSGSAVLGGFPTTTVDIPICAVFLALFAGGAVTHMTLFRRNLSRKHKFIPSAVTFGFCMSRVAANSVRIAWATQIRNSGLAIASQILVAAGVVLLFILNLLFVQRILRAVYPRLGWARVTSYAFKTVYIALVLAIVMVITVTVQSINTRNRNTHRIDHDVMLAAVVYITVVAFLPLPILLAILLTAPKRIARAESFGSGSWQAKVAIVTVASVFMCLGASFRAATAWLPPAPAAHPPWYYRKAAFYVFDFTLEIITVYMYLFGRIDLRFHVPDGSSKTRRYRDRSEPPSETASGSGVVTGDEGLDGRKESRDLESAWAKHDTRPPGLE